MFSKIATLILFLFVFQFSFSQGQFPKGCYMNLDELKSKSPGNTCNLQVEKRTTSDIKMVGGNDYKLISPDKSVSKKVIKGEILAYSTGDTLYLNCARFKLQSWYTKIICDGRYFVFWAGIPMENSMRDDDMHLEYMLGAIGGGIAGASNATKRFLYALDIDSNKLYFVNDDFVRDLLTEYPELLEQFNKWASKSDFNSQIYYLNFINALYLEKMGDVSGS